jgi:hypothetical protein
MPEYRFFHVARNGHIYEPPIGVEAAGDAEALKLARAQVRSGDIEVWQGMRLVAYLTPEQFAPVARTGSEPDQSPQA